MARIVPKLNLNKTPQLVENNSLVFAKNIKLLKDNTIGPDTSLKEIETHTGRAIHHVEHHEAIIENVTKYYYSILDFKNTIKYSAHEELAPDPEFIFATDIPEDPFDDKYRDSDRGKYSYIPENEVHRISCYTLHNYLNPSWTMGVFTFNVNSGELVENSGLVFFIGVRTEVYYNQPYNYDLRAPKFFYFIAPREWQGNTLYNVFVPGCSYVVFNPVLRIKRLEEVVVQDEYDEEWDTYDTIEYIAQIVGLNNKVYFFKENDYIKFSDEAKTVILEEYPNEVFVGDEALETQIETFDVDENGYITRNGVIFKDSRITEILFPDIRDRIKIFEYNEVSNTFTIVKCAWRYSGGNNITGCVSVNGTGEFILTVCESNLPNNVLVPIKHINLNNCTENDDESFYTQAPNIPISNLRLSGRYIKNIPAGVYQFFIRYKIHEGFYTNWFPCSKDLFAGSRKITDTLQGSLKHVDLHEDSNNSFVFTVEHLYPEFCSNYEQFQLGFILSSDGGIFARSWKHFDMGLASTVSIYFDYYKTDVEEINIDDLLNSSYNIFNVQNIAQYKNRLYISNYIETDFNDPNLQELARNIKINFDLQRISLNSGFYINNIPLVEEISGIYTSFDNRPVRSIYYDSMYCNNTVDTETVTTETLELGTFPANTVDAQGNPFEPNYPAVLNPEVVKLIVIDEHDTEHNILIYEPVIEIENENQDTIINTVIDKVKEKILGIDANGNFIIELNGVNLIIKAFVVEYYTYGAVEKEHTTIETTVNGHDVDRPAWRYSRKKYTKQLKVKVALKGSILSTDYVYNEYNTFLPFTKYDFYVHYVTQNGIVTNGYYIGTKEIKRYCKQYKPIPRRNVPSDVIANDELTYLDEFDNIADLAWYTPELKEYAFMTAEDQYFKLTEITTNDHIIVADYMNIVCPPGYVSCFISCTKYGNNVSQGYNYEHEYNALDDVTVHKVDCLDLNCLLYNATMDIEIKDSKGNTLSESANYYSSSTTKPLKYLGGSGHIEFSTVGDTAIDTKCWLIIDSVGKPYNKQLIKITPFIKLNEEEAISYLPIIDANSPGYFCEVVTLSRRYCYDPDGYYVSGNDIYSRDNTDSSMNLELVEDRVEYHNSSLNYIFSNYNLNYVSLTVDLNPIIRRYNIDREGDTQGNTVEEGLITHSDKQLITLVNSLLASYSLELKSFYKEYTRKLYQEYTRNKLTTFNNTIRVSSVDVDEIYRYIYKFEATEYYNVPTHRGVITNLISIANSLYVHCEHSLFKFTDNKTLNGQEEEITLQENDIFNSGISEVFDAQYGYAGLNDKKQSLVTYNAYVFYDSVAKIIYAFGGEQQIANIGEPIQKIINVVNPVDVQFVGDEINDRFFINLRNAVGNVCLSFNFKTKAFVSIHDIDFKFGFHTRRHTYFVHDNLFNNVKIGWSIYRITDKIVINNEDYYIAYQNCYKPSLISIDDIPTPNGLNAAYACIDVITNIEYEKIKNLNYVNWICSEILSYGDNLNFVAEEELNRLYPGDKIRIYSDSTSTLLFNLTDDNGNAKLSNEQRNINEYGNPFPTEKSWQYPVYNCGVFSMNYFRNIIKNGNLYVEENPDLFKYKEAIGNNSEIVDLTEYPQRQNLTQENSLVYGKYFVIRLIFNNRNFKIENVTFRMNDYGKTK